jgi:hypothetical protein
VDVEGKGATDSRSADISIGYTTQKRLEWENRSKCEAENRSFEVEMTAFFVDARAIYQIFRYGGVQQDEK